MIISKTLHNAVIKNPHIIHMGILKMKTVIRNHCTSRNINNDIEETAKSYRHCHFKQNHPTKEICHHWQHPIGRWERKCINSG